MTKKGNDGPRDLHCPVPGCTSCFDHKSYLKQHVQTCSKKLSGVKKRTKRSDVLDELQQTLDKWSVVVARDNEQVAVEEVRAQVSERRLDSSEQDRHLLIETNAKLTESNSQLIAAFVAVLDCKNRSAHA